MKWVIFEENRIILFHDFNRGGLWDTNGRATFWGPVLLGVSSITTAADNIHHITAFPFRVISSKTNISARTCGSRKKLIRNSLNQGTENRFRNPLAVYQKRILPPTNPSPWDNTSKIPLIKPLSIGTTWSQQNNSTILTGNEFIRISKWGRRKFWSLSYEFWLGRRFDYERKFKFGGFHLRSRQIIQTCNILN